uniref:ATP synthase F0 subunit 8 n=1 Tax=Eupristina koningsbergeri TaxID=318089 RepID=A0A8A3YF03_9HYME|nr:ATP synthase F0 subunit 8 [Eupristina koningsbergeri]
MPQMKPLYWMNLYIIVLLLLVLFMVFIHYLFIYKCDDIVSLNNKDINLIWLW